VSYDLFDVPDGITPVVGIRGWRYKDSRLWSCYRDIEWPTNSHVTSSCIHPTNYVVGEYGLRPKTHKYGAPQKNCTCGIYALSEWPEGNIKKVRPWPSDAVTGVILGWGHVVMGSKGFRAQYAKPIALISRPRSTKLTGIIEEMLYVYGLDLLDQKEVQNGHWKDITRDYYRAD
jgi:hypothetical protein